MFRRICNPPKFTIRICNPLKPHIYIMMYVGERIANPPGGTSMLTPELRMTSKGGKSRCKRPSFNV